MIDVDESAALFGPNRSLLGILSRSTTQQAAPFACLLLNAGIIHRIGPHRLNVKLARRLAASGVPCLRFDLSGHGDSLGASDGVHHSVQAVRDLVAAMDHVQAQTGIRRFLVFGICSGAVNGFAAALADDRVVGLSMVDGFMFPSPAAVWRSRLQRLSAIPGNRVMLDRTWQWSKRRWATRGAVANSRPNPSVRTPAAFAAEMTALLARNVEVQLIYTATTQSADTGRSQLGVFGNAGFVDRLHYAFLPDVDHTVTSQASQRQVMDAVCAWANKEVRRNHAVDRPVVHALA